MKNMLETGSTQTGSRRFLRAYSDFFFNRRMADPFNTPPPLTFPPCFAIIFSPKLQSCGKEELRIKTTGELEQEIREADSLSPLSAEELRLPPLPEYLRGLLTGRGLTVRDVVVRCGLDRSCACQLFNGTRRSSRDFWVLLSLVLG